MVAVGSPVEGSGREAILLFVIYSSSKDNDNGADDNVPLWMMENKFIAEELRDDFEKSVAFSINKNSNINYTMIGATQETKRGFEYVTILSSRLDNNNGTTTWTVTDKLFTNNEEERNSQFGSSLAVGGNAVILGAENSNRNDTSGNSGAVHSFSVC